MAKNCGEVKCPLTFDIFKSNRGIFNNSPSERKKIPSHTKNVSDDDIKIKKNPNPIDKKPNPITKMFFLKFSVIPNLCNERLTIP